MTAGDRLLMRVILTGAVLIPLTILVIYAMYGSYLFSKWPWLRFSAVMSVLTCLWAFTFGFGRVTGGETKEASITTSIGFGLLVIPFDLLLMVPHPRALGLGNDKYFVGFMLVLEIIHGSGFYFIQRKIEQFMSKDRPNVSIGDEISIGIGSSARKAIVFRIYDNSGGSGSLDNFSKELSVALHS